MAGPDDARGAIRWAREALPAGRYRASVHFNDRLKERGVTIADVFAAVAHARSAEPYPSMPQHGGTCWRIHGRDADGDRVLGIGVEAFDDEEGQPSVVLCTIVEVTS